MPVEIKELIIRAVADRERDVDARARRAQPGDGGWLSTEERDLIVRTCVREVMRLLEKTRER